MEFGILNIIFGAIVLSPSFVPEESRQKYAKAISWAGIILLIWGVMGIVSAVLHLQVLASAPVYWALWLAGGIIGLLMGIILGINLLKKSADGIVNKILPYQRIIGLSAIIVGVLQLIVGE